MSNGTTPGVGLARIQELTDPPDADLGMGVIDEGGTLAGAGRPLDHSEVKGILQREIEDSLGGLGSKISEEQRQAIRMYYGRPIGNEVQDRSQVVTRDVLEVIEWTMPSLMRMFTGGPTVARFSPTKPGPEAQRAADLATAYLNQCFLYDMDGEQILYDWFKTALLEKNGVVKAYYEERREPKIDTYTGITEDQLLSIVSEEDVEVISHEERQMMMPVMGPEGPVQVPVPVHDIEVRVWKIERRLRVDAVPPEEFMIARRVVRLDDSTPFAGQRKKQTVSDLVAMGYPFDIVANIPSDDTPEYSMGRTERLSEDETYPVTTAERSDAASRDVWTVEAYLRIDEDGDGYSELRRIVAIGEQSVTILDDEEVNMNPFVSITPIPMPHKFYGLSQADITVDIQVIRTTFLRQFLDHLYLANNPRLAITEGMVEVDDLLTVRPGGLVRQRAPGNIEPIELPRLPQESFEMFREMENIRTGRTGVMAHGSELDASAINSTATGMSVMQAEKQQKVELIARMFGKGVRQLFSKLLRLLVENDTKEHQVMMNGEWVSFDPSTWDADMRCTIEVGLGAGAAVERMMNLERMGNIQERIAGATGGLGYIIEPRHVYETGKRMAEAAGFRNPDMFFSDPTNRPPPPPPPNPDMEKLKATAAKEQAEMQLAAARLELDREKEEHIVAHRAAELQQKFMVEMERIRMEERVRLGQQEATLEAAEISAEARNAQNPPEGERDE